MRPTQKGLDVLRDALAAAEVELESVKRQIAVGTQPTMDALTEAEVQRSMLAAEGVRVSRELSVVSREIEELHAVLDALHRRREAAEAERDALKVRQQESELKVSSLAARLAKERDEAAPLLKSRQGTVDKLSRRIQVRTAHREARLSVLFPGDADVR